ADCQFEGRLPAECMETCGMRNASPSVAVLQTARLLIAKQDYRTLHGVPRPSPRTHRQGRRKAGIRPALGRFPGETVPSPDRKWIENRQKGSSCKEKPAARPMHLRSLACPRSTYFRFRFAPAPRELRATVAAGPRQSTVMKRVFSLVIPTQTGP